MRYSEAKPDSGASSLVSEFWIFEAGELPGGPTDHVIPPDGLVSLWAAFEPDGPAFCGVTGPSPRAHRTEIKPRQTVVGARLRPGTASPLLGASMNALAGGVLPLDAIAPDRELAFRCAAAHRLLGDWTALNEFFAALAAQTPPPDPVARRMAETLIESDGAAAIGALTAETGLSPRQARRRFEAAMGVAPKSFARIRRLRRACRDALNETQSLTGLSLEAGFADQAHLSRSFQEAFDLPPGKVRAYIRRIAHGDVYSA